MADEGDQVGNLTGVERAAAFLLMLSEREASEILRHVEPGQIHTLAGAMSTLPDLTPEQVRQIVLDFCKMAGQSSALGANADAQRHVRKLLVLALGKDNANEVISKLSLLDRRAGGMESLARREPREIAEMMNGEHPQAIATLLAYQESRVAGQVLSLMDAETQNDVVLRMATLEKVSLSAMEELNALVIDHLDNEDVGATASQIGGPRVAASVLNNLDSSIQGDILASIKAHDEALGEIIEASMFTFDDLLKIDDTAVQSLLGETSSQVLCTALKGAGDETKEKFFNNMSKRAAEMLAEDLEIRGPVKLSEVESAQREIVEAARRLMEAGTIVVGGVGGGEDLVY
ncbi:MAG: flagellar motor switch protein FliG [Chromatiales bacterium]|jgi:flagellar motor switch protein FliG|nr:flagellar motor switch protein FliG [Chromatiales bacterium]